MTEDIPQQIRAILGRWRPLLLRMSGSCECHEASACAAACKAGRHHVGCEREGE